MPRLIGEITLFAGPFTPEGYMPCDGRLLPVKDWQALYSIIGNVYGGDGIKDFALPDLRARVPVGLNINSSLGDGRVSRSLGEAGGVEAYRLAEKNIPPHAHDLSGGVAVKILVSEQDGNQSSGKRAFLAKASDAIGADVKAYRAADASEASPTEELGGVTVTNTLRLATPTASGAQASLPRDPYLTVRYLIAVGGGDAEYPVRDDALTDQ